MSTHVMVKGLKTRFAQMGMMEMSYQRNKALGYMAIHTHVLISTTENPQLDNVISEIMNTLLFTQLGNSHKTHTSNVGCTSFVNYDAITIHIMHSKDGEIISATIQYCSD